MVRSFRDPPPAPDPDLPRPAEQLPSAGPAVPVPDGDRSPAADLATTLRRRVAQRAYAPEPVDPVALWSAVQAGVGLDRRSWPDEHRCCPLEVVVLALRVDGLPPACYRVEAGPDRFVPVAELPAGNPADLVLQREFAAAGALVSILSDVDTAVARHGGHGYRTLLTRAGAVGYACWLDAVARGLAGTVFAGFLPAAARQQLRLDGANRHQLVAVALGCPPEAGPAPGADTPRLGSATA